MSERTDNGNFQNRCQTNPTKMPQNDLGNRKTLFVMVIVVGCFAVLWPKVFYPMLVGPTNSRMKPNHLDKGCCDVISDIDVNTIKIMSELCNTIVQYSEEKPLKAQEILRQCRSEIFNKCGIDISIILQEQVRLGRSFKQIVDEVRSFNGSLCLKYQFGISPWRLGIPHRVTINLSPISDVKQERPSHLRPEMLHPALREKGSAIVQPYQPPSKSGHPKFIEGRPGPVPGVRPPLGAAAHMVHSPKSSNSMGVIMPIYTIGIVIFFSYTLMKLLFKKKPEGPGAPLYPTVESSATFRKDVFESQKIKSSQGPPSLIVNAMTALLDEVDQELEARRKAREVTSQKEEVSDGDGLVNGCAKKLEEHEKPSVKILGMEMTASCEGGQKWERPQSPVIPKAAPPEPSTPPQEIFLEGTLPAQSQILVADSTVEEETNSISSSLDPPVVLASKMTLSVISLDAHENGKLQNGDVAKHDEDDVVDESKYTTASGATAAESDISDEEASDVVDEVEEVDEDVMDNDIEEIDDMHDETDDNSLDEMEIEEIIVFEDDVNEIDDFLYEDQRKVDIFISDEAVENIGNFIDEIITDGTRRIEAAENDIDNNVIINKLEQSTGQLVENSNITEDDVDSAKIGTNVGECDINNDENAEENDNIGESPLIRTDNHFLEITDDNCTERHSTSENKNADNNLEDVSRITLDTTEVDTTE